ncbi:MAG: hypothetical protein Q9181_005452 [Wetmoreana brouardii]
MAAELPGSYDDPVNIAIIGGTGLGSLPSPPFTPVATLPPPPTPWGLPSSPIAILSYAPPTLPANGEPQRPIAIAFLARHGLHHQFAPHEIPNQANIAALRKLGVRCVVAFSAVGSLKEEVKPRDFVVVDQVIDWTRGVRPWTFFEGGMVGHVGFADPFDLNLSRVVSAAVGKPGVLEGENALLHPKGTVICIEGPQFSTRAESLFYRNVLNASVINMSAVPEAKLAREAEMAYSMVCMSTDYDSWHETNETVSVEMVMGHMKMNSVNARRAVEAIIEALGKQENGAIIQAEHWKEMTKGAGGITKTEGRSSEALEKLRWLFPGYFEQDKWTHSSAMSIQQLEAMGVDVNGIPLASPPPGVAQNLANPASRTYQIYIVSAVFLALTISFMVIRFYAKLYIQRSRTWDDYAAIAGLKPNRDPGKHLWDTTIGDYSNQGFVVQLVGTVIYGPTIFFIKLALFLLYLHLFGRLRWMRYSVWFGITITGLFYVSGLIVPFGLCAPRGGKTWLDMSMTPRCRNSEDYGIAQGVMNLISDFYLLIIPIPAVMSLQLPQKKKFGVIAIFMTGFLACVVSTVSLGLRIIYNKTEDITWNVVTLYIMTIVEMNVGLMVACMPSIATVLRQHEGPLAFLISLISSKFRSLTSGWGSGKGKSPKGSPESSLASRHERYIELRSGIDGRGNLSLVPGGVV